LESSLDSMDMDVDDVATVQRSLPLHDGNMPAMVKTMECRKSMSIVCICTMSWPHTTRRHLYQLLCSHCRYIRLHADCCLYMYMYVCVPYTIMRHFCINYY
jgi:hypothetical protein